jgi:hypothetical protein
MREGWEVRGVEEGAEDAALRDSCMDWEEVRVFVINFDSGFNSWWLHVKFIVVEVTLHQNFTPKFSLSLLGSPMQIINPPLHRTCLSLHPEE